MLRNPDVDPITVFSEHFAQEEVKSTNEEAPVSVDLSNIPNDAALDFSAVKWVSPSGMSAEELEAFGIADVLNENESVEFVSSGTSPADTPDERALDDGSWI